MATEHYASQGQFIFLRNIQCSPKYWLGFYNVWLHLNHLFLDKLYVSDILEDVEVLERGRIPVDWEEDGDAALLGNDFVFCTAFVTSFLFNWVGFLLLMCFCHTIAARWNTIITESYLSVNYIESLHREFRTDLSISRQI